MFSVIGVRFVLLSFHPIVDWNIRNRFRFSKSFADIGAQRTRARVSNDHFGLLEVAAKLVQLREPESEATLVVNYGNGPW